MDYETTNNMGTLHRYFLNVALKICFIFLINGGRRVYVQPLVDNP